MSASRHTYGVTIRGVFTDFFGEAADVFALIHNGSKGPAVFGSKRDADALAAEMNSAWPSNDDTPNYAVIQRR